MWPNVEAGGADDLIFFAMFYSGLIALMFWLVIGAEYQKARRDQQGPPEIHEDEKGYFTREVSYSFWRGRQERTKVCPPPE